MGKEANYRMVRLPKDLAERLDRIGAELLAAHEAGRTKRVKVTEQGERGSWVSLAETIRVCVDDFEAHKERSRKQRKKPQAQ